jgi:hypothetical protein
MPIQLINSFASWVLKQRIHQIELFLKYPNEVQGLLMDLIQSAKNTELGKETILRYVLMTTERVPISTYEEFQPLIERTRNGEQNIFLGNPYKMVCEIKRND